MVDLDTQSVEAVFVSPPATGKGIGRTLLCELEDLAMNNGIGSLKLLSSLNAIDFYKMTGYQVERKEAFAHPNGFDIDCYRMSKQL